MVDGTDGTTGGAAGTQGATDDKTTAPGTPGAGNTGDGSLLGADSGKQGSDGKQAEGDKGKPADTTTAELDLKLPKGMEANEDFASFKKTAQELGLKSEQAQKVLDLYASVQTRSESRQTEAFEKQRSDWREQVKADKEIGGAQLESSLRMAKSAVAKFGSPELSALLNGPLGDHPAVVKAFAKIGKAMGEDSIAGANPGEADGTNSEDAKLRRMFPTMFKTQE